MSIRFRYANYICHTVGGCSSYRKYEVLGRLSVAGHGAAKKLLNKLITELTSARHVEQETPF